MYSKEEGSNACTLKGQISKKMKSERFDRIMAVQSEISLEKNKELVGKSFKALVDDVDNEIAVGKNLFPGAGNRWRCPHS